jgi:hypothetical protein
MIRRAALGICALVTLVACLFHFQSSATQAAPPNKTKLDPPIVSCAGATPAAITLQVCAGASGAPAGFSLQWMTLDAYVANGEAWLPSDDPGLCKASFSGNANDSRYVLAPGGCVQVEIGDLLFDNGTSSNCADALLCGTTYVFRSFAHATSSLAKSDFSGNVACATERCPSNCYALSQGYWRNHNPEVCLTTPDSPLCIAWPVNSLTIGTVNYTIPELVSILETPSGGNGLISLAHQVIAVKLSIAAFGVNPQDPNVLVNLAAADALIGGLVIPPVGGGFLAPKVTADLTNALDVG